MITFRQSGDFRKTKEFLDNAQHPNFSPILERYAMLGVKALSQNTPIDTGVSADSWTYEVKQNGQSFGITWMNTDVTPSGTPIVILLQYGHGTNGGSYVQGQDFINPAIKPIFDKLCQDLWEEVTSA